MTTYQWLLVFHIAGAFLLVSGATAAAALKVVALRSEQPREIALLLRLALPAVVVTMVGMVVVLGFGLWLVVHIDGYDIGDGWIVAALLLWVVGSAAGEYGGRRAKPARKLAQQLVADGAGDAPSDELRRRLRDPVSNAVDALSMAAMVAVLVLMVWKPGV